MFFGVLVIIFASLILNYFFALIGSALIVSETCPRVCYKIVCGPYPKWTYGFASPVALWKVVVRVLVGCSDLSASIDCFAWSKISIKFFIQALFFIVYLCVSYLLYQRSLILKLVLGCVRKFSMGHIQTVHTDLLQPQVCGRSWWGWQFLWFHLSPSINWLASRQVIKLVTGD